MALAKRSIPEEVYIFLISQTKQMLWVLIRSASHLFSSVEIRKVSNSGKQILVGQVNFDHLLVS